MNKQTFLEQLRLRLGNLPQHDIDEHLAFYAEMLDDRIEDGLSEEAAVAAVGNVDDIAAQIIADTPLGVLVKERIKSRRTGTFRTVLLILGSPVWLPLLIAAFAVVLSVYVSLWAVVVSLWSVFGAFVACAFGGLAGGASLITFSNPFAGVALIACSLVCAGLSIFAFFGCKAVTRGTAWLTKAMLRGMKRLFVRKEVLA